MAAEDHLKAGWLEKQGKKFKKFHKRYELIEMNYQYMLLPHALSLITGFPVGTRFIIIRRTGKILCYHDDKGSKEKLLLRLQKRLGSVECNKGSKTDFTVSRYRRVLNLLVLYVTTHVNITALQG